MDVSEAKVSIVERVPVDGLAFFFFQAEDGIRDLTVTGVQTCALPIWPRSPDGAGRPRSGAPLPRRTPRPRTPRRRARTRAEAQAAVRPRRRCTRALRSEERRVGKECRSRWSPDH